MVTRSACPRSSTARTLSAEYLHPERMSAIRAIQGVPNAPLSQLVKFKRDIAKMSEGRRYIGLASIARNTGQLSDIREAATGQCIVFKKGDVLYGRLRPYLNKVWVADSDGECSTEFHVMQPYDQGTLRSEYLAVVLRTRLIVAQTKHMMTGNTHPRIANGDVETLLVPLANCTVQRAIVEDTLSRQAERHSLAGRRRGRMAGGPRTPSNKSFCSEAGHDRVRHPAHVAGRPLP